MEYVKQATCKFCGNPIDLNHDYYRHHTQLDGKQYFWHSDTSNPAKDCWHKHWQYVNRPTAKIEPGGQRRFF